MTAIPTELSVGTEIPPVVRPDQGFEHWNRYAAVNDEFVGIHMSDPHGQAAGYPGAFGMGNLSTAYLHIMLRRWMGPGRIVSLSLQLRNPLLKGTTLTARGVISAVSATPDGTLVDLDVWTENSEGQQVAPGKARVLLPA